MGGIQKFENIIKSCEDNRFYRGLEFPNKLKVILISDPKTEKSAAALDVNVGFLSDPDDVEGIAHFCEHMLFLGTEKYPMENEYNKYLSENGGSANAYTTTDHTKYFFEVLPDHLQGALDRFAQFFIKPLFTESATSREVNAVDSEHEKNISQDTWRLSELEKHFTKVGHPYRKFGTGNKKTLEEGPKSRGLNVRSILLDFHSQWYSANTMTLAVLGRENLDELEAMVSPLFTQVVNKEVTAPEWLDHPVGPDQVRLQVSVVPIEDVRNLSISFPMPDFHEHYKSAPCHYISHLIGHEGPGSLLSALKERGWCNCLSSGDHCPAKGFSTFTIRADLTIEGLDHVHDIVTLLFQYLNMLRETEPQEWIKEECRKLLDATFRFKDKETPHKYVSGIVSSMHLYPMDEALSAPFFLDEWRPDLIKKILNLLVPSQIRMAIVSKSFESKANLEEPWYGTKFAVETIEKSTIEMWENCGLCDELKFPEPNVFIPDNYDLLPLVETEVTKNPVQIYNSDIARLWFKQDDVFRLPRTSFTFEIYNPLAYMDPLNECLTAMYAALLKDGLNEYAYNASLAGLNWTISNTKYGLQAAVSGYSDKLEVLFEKIVDKMTTFVTNEKRFEILKEHFIREMRNFQLKPPFKQAGHYMASLLAEHSWSYEERLAVANEVTPDALNQYVSTLLNRIHIEGLAYGNIDKEQAVMFMKRLEAKLSAKRPAMPLRPQQLFRGREIQLVDGSHFLYEARNQVHKSSSTDTYFQCGMRNTQVNMELELLAQIINEPCFDILRTKEQLGYLVWSFLRRSNGVQGLRFLIQSDRHPDYVNERIEAFLEQMRDHLANLSQENFEKHREALAALRLEKPKKMYEQIVVYWGEISSQEYHFDRAEIEVAYLKTIKLEQILAFFDRYIAHNAPNRHQFSVHVISDADGGAGTLTNTTTPETPDDLKNLKIKKPTLIDDVPSFKASHGLYPLPQPYININHTKSKL